MTEKFYKVNDYDWVLPSDSQKGHNHLRELVNSLFKSGELLFCLLERVTITNKTGIGSTYIYSHLPKKEEEKIYEKYKQVVKQVQSSKKINPTEYVEWYKSQKSYFLIDANEEADVSVFEDETFNWGDNWKPKNESDNNITIELKSNLQSTKIIEYLNFYAEKLRKELDFSKYPHFAVLIKPVCVVNDATGTVYPLGNLFLHFATKDKKEEQFYVELINKFLLVWFRVQGSKLIEEIQTETKHRIELELSDEKHLPQLSSKAKKRLTEKLNGSNHSLKDYFDKHQTSTEHHKEFKKKADELKEKTIQYLLHHLNISKQTKEPSLGIIEDLHRKEVAGLKDLHENFDLFQSILLRRKLFFISYLLFNHDIRKIHSFMTGSNLTIQSKSNVDSVYNYFLINLAISLGKPSSQLDEAKRWEKLHSPDTRKSVYKQLTKREGKYLSVCFKHIESLLNSTQKTQFNKLVLSELTSS